MDLHDHLVQAYRATTPSDLVFGMPISIDPKSRTDVAAHRCEVTVSVIGPDRLELLLQNYPNSPVLREHFEKIGAEPGNGDNVVTIKLTFMDSKTMRELAQAFRRVIGRSTPRYDNKNWKWVCTHTADALEEFARQLRAYRSLKARTRTMA